MSGTCAQNVTNLAPLLRGRVTSMTQRITGRVDKADVLVVIYTMVGLLVGTVYFIATFDLKLALHAMVVQIGILCVVQTTLSFFWHVILDKT